MKSKSPTSAALRLRSCVGRVRASELPKVVPEGCGLVWSFVRARQLRAGRHVAVYWDCTIRLEVGVELIHLFQDGGDVVQSATPAGRAASVAHSVPMITWYGSPVAILGGSAQNLELAGPNWEVYGHWQDEWNADPSDSDRCVLPVGRALADLPRRAVLLEQASPISTCCTFDFGDPLPPRPVVRVASLDGRRAVLILAPGIGAAIEKGATAAAQRVRTARWRGVARFVDSVRIGTGFDETGDRRGLCPGFTARAGPAVGSVVKRLGAATIPRPNISPHDDRLSHDLESVGSGGDVERRVALVHVVPDLVEEVRLSSLTGRASLGLRRRQYRRRGK